MNHETSLDALDAIERELARQDGQLASAHAQLQPFGDIELAPSEGFFDPFESACRVGALPFHDSMPFTGIRG